MTRATPASTYDDDFFAWTQEQAAALRQMPIAAGAPTLDIEHVAEEIEDLGKRDLREVSSFLERLFEHLMKIESVPGSQTVAHWRSEIRLFRRSAAAAFSESMRQLIDLDKIWRRGRKAAQDDMQDIGITLSVPAACPFNLDDLLSEDFDIDTALAKLAAAKAAPRRDVP